MDARAKILVVDDEAAIRFFLEEALTRDGYEVAAVDGGEAALQRLAAEKFDVALIDLKMKGIGGIEVLTALRQQASDTAAIVLTAYGSLETAIDALRLGAHDYLFKPCKTTDLRESVRAALMKQRREHRQRELLAELESTLAQQLEEIRAVAAPLSDVPDAALPSPKSEPSSQGKQMGLVVDQIRHVITLDGRPLDLSPTEFSLVAYLADAAPRVVDPQELIRQVQGYECEPHEARDMVRYHIHRIRQKAKRSGGDGDLILTVRGIGYTLRIRGQA